MTDAKVICCGKELVEDAKVQKWPCPKCGNVFIIIGKRDVKASGGEHDE